MEERHWGTRTAFGVPGAIKAISLQRIHFNGFIKSLNFRVVTSSSSLLVRDSKRVARLWVMWTLRLRSEFCLLKNFFWTNKASKTSKSREDPEILEKEYPKRYQRFLKKTVAGNHSLETLEVPNWKSPTICRSSMHSIRH